MRQSTLFTTTRKEAPHEETSKNAILLQRGGYIDKALAGAYSYLPLGLRVIKKISTIVREEMDSLPRTQEILMPALQPRELWQETGRWDDPGMREVMYRVGEGDVVALGATHEENITDLFRKLFHSYKELPVAAYQIQTKFRNEPRAKSGLLRGREFIMKDLYSFHSSEEDLDQYYEQAAEAYLRVFARCGIAAVRTEASGGVFSKQHSDEFQAVCEVGEDTIYLNAEGTRAWNKEVVTDESDPRLKEWGGGEARAVQAIEVGNIFRLGTKYSAQMGAVVTLENGETQPAYMGCYGIGVSRLMGTVVEIYGDSTGKGARIVWPEAIAPVRVHLLDLTNERKAEPLYLMLQEAGLEVLFDDRDRRAGEKFADADLIGAPWRVVVSERSLEAGGAEVQRWPEEQADILAFETVAGRVR